jgi:putative ABC transport system permease protein
MRELLAQTWQNLTANRLRSFLTMFGVAWGVAAIVILSATGEGFQRGNQRVLEELGKNIVIIRNGRTSLQAGGQRAGRIIRLTLDDVHALRAKARLLEYVSPELMRTVNAKSRFNAGSLQMSGVWPDYLYMRTIEIEIGRPFRQLDCDEARRVVVIGFEASKQLFADRSPIGQQVFLNGIPYEVVGRIRKKLQDSNYTGWDDERLFIPYETMRRDFPLPFENYTESSLSAIIASSHPWVVDDLERLFDDNTAFIQLALGADSPVEQEVREILAPRKRFKPDDTEALNFWNTALEAVFFKKMIAAMDSFFLSVSLITLALGGIGVMNIMLISVRERTHEIGIRKALGATERVIARQFFLEGLLLTLLAGAVGFAVGYGLCSVVNLAPMPERFAGMVVTWPTVVLAMATLALVGVVASTYPARRAAVLPPVEALRYEI